MTEAEKRNIFLLVAPPELHHEIDEWSHGEGMSIFVDNQWIGGAVFLDQTNHLVGGMISEVQGLGKWIEVWPELITWAHTVHQEVIMEMREEMVTNLALKLGAFRTFITEKGNYEAHFSKEFTKNFLQNNDLRSLQME